MKKLHLIVPIIIGILVVSVFSAPTVKAATIGELQAQIQHLLSIITQLQQQILRIKGIAKPVPPKPISGQCSWCGLSCTRIQPWMYCPQIVPPAGYECREVNNVCTKVPKASPNRCATFDGKYSMTLAEAKNIFRNSECAKLGNPDNLTVECNQCSPYMNGDLYNAIYGPNYNLADRAAYKISSRVGDCIIDLKTKRAWINRGTSFCTGATDVGYSSTVICAMKGTSQEGWYKVNGPDVVSLSNTNGLRIKLLKSGKCSGCQLKCIPDDPATGGDDAAIDTCDNKIVFDVTKEYGPEVSCRSIVTSPKDPAFIERLIRSFISPVVTNVPPSTCHDSDGGKNYYVKGYVYKAASYPNIGLTQRFYDTCTSSRTLKEYYCGSDGNIKSTSYTCSSGYTCQSGACRQTSPTPPTTTPVITKPINMLIFLSPQYANDSDIQEAINTYTKAVKEDVNWNSKIIFLSKENNDYHKIDEIIEKYYNSYGIKAAIMVGEDIDTPPRVDGMSCIESPSVTPWASLESYEVHKGCIVQSGQPRKIDVVISLLYPPHNLNYTERKSQIINVFRKFSRNRDQIYPKKFVAFIDNEIASYHPEEVADLQSLSNYGNLWYKESPTAEELQTSLSTRYGIYVASGHASPSGIQINPLKHVYLSVKQAQNIQSPLFLGEGCNVSGWYCVNNNKHNCLDSARNQKLDPSTDDNWFGAKIFTNPNLRVMVLSAPSQVCRSNETYDFFDQVLPDLMKGKTLAESFSGKYLCSPDDDTIYGDPTFHFVFQSSIPTCHDSDGGKNYYVKGYVYKAASYPNIGLTQRFYDTCTSSRTLKEYYCANDNIQSTSYTCPSGYACQDGACAVAAPIPPSILYKTEWDGDSLTATLLRSDNGGKTWKKIMEQYRGGITYTTYSKNPLIIYAGDSGGNTRSEDLDINLNKSINGGNSWTNILGGITNPSQNPEGSPTIIGTDDPIRGIISIWVSSNNPNIVKVKIAGENRSYVFSSTNGGYSWTKQNNNTCTDTDGGYNYYTKGSCYDDTTGKTYSDYCDEEKGGTKKGGLEEVGCKYVPIGGGSPNIAGHTVCVYSSYTCPYGCQDGACLPPPVPAPSSPSALNTLRSQLAQIQNILNKLTASIANLHLAH